jgi:hypothetical protein
MNQAQPAQPSAAGSETAPIGQFDARGPADHDVFDVAGTVEENADLTSDLGRKLGHGPRQIIGDQAIFLQTSASESLECFGLVCLETGRIAVNWNGMLLPQGGIGVTVGCRLPESVWLDAASILRANGAADWNRRER